MIYFDLKFIENLYIEVEKYENPEKSISIANCIRLFEDINLKINIKDDINISKEFKDILIRRKGINLEIFQEDIKLRPGDVYFSDLSNEEIKTKAKKHNCLVFNYETLLNESYIYFDTQFLHIKKGNKISDIRADFFKNTKYANVEMKIQDPYLIELCDENLSVTIELLDKFFENIKIKKIYSYSKIFNTDIKCKVDTINENATLNIYKSNPSGGIIEIKTKDNKFHNRNIISNYVIIISEKGFWLEKKVEENPEFKKNIIDDNQVFVFFPIFHYSKDTNQYKFSDLKSKIEIK